MSNRIHELFHTCSNRAERVACVASAMRRLGEGCTDTDLMTHLGITKSDLLSVADDARAKAVVDSTRETIARRAA